MEGGGWWQRWRLRPARWLRQTVWRRRPLACLHSPPSTRLASSSPAAARNVAHRAGVAAARARNRGAMSEAGGCRGSGCRVPPRAPWSAVAATAALCLLLATSVCTARAAPMSREEKQKLGNQVLEMFDHAYGNYMEHAYPADELMPLTCRGRVRGQEPSRGGS